MIVDWLPFFEGPFSVSLDWLLLGIGIIQKLCPSTQTLDPINLGCDLKVSATLSSCVYGTRIVSEKVLGLSKQYGCELEAAVLLHLHCFVH